MSGNYSKFTFDPKKSYSNVLMQQGKILVDSDWNEMQSIHNWKQESVVKDLIVSVAFPQNDAAFAPSVEGGLHFNGKENFVFIEKQGLLFEGDKPFSIQVKVKIEQLTGSMAFLSQWQDSEAYDIESGYCFGVKKDGQLYFMRSISVSGDVFIEEILCERRLRKGVFEDIALTYDGRDLRIFCDGQCVGKSEEEQICLFKEAPTVMGAFLEKSSARDFFHGELKDLRVWSRCLTEQEIRQKAQIRPQAVGLQAWWPLTEGGGEIAHDLSGNGFDGYLGARQEKNAPRFLAPSLSFSEGRMYLGGFCTMAEKKEGLPIPKSANEKTYFYSYVEMSLEEVSSVEDPQIGEPALGKRAGSTREKTQLVIKNFPELHGLTCRKILKESWDKFREPFSRKGKLSLSVLPEHPLFENTLYRVQIAKNVDRKNGEELSILWSRDNSSISFAAKLIEKNCLEVSGLEDCYHPLKVGDGIRLRSADGKVLASKDTLVTVTDVDYEKERIFLSESLPKGQEKFLIEHWDGICQTQENKAIVDERFVIECEESSYYHEGDYWLIPSRRANNSLFFPQNEWKEAHGVRRHFALLAEYESEDHAYFVKNDKRQSFHTATDSDRYLRTSGGKLSGSLEIEETLDVLGDMEVHGELRVKGRLSSHCVGSSQLKDQSVNYQKIQKNLGLQLGQCILSQSPKAPPGFSRVGKLLGDTENSSWRDLHQEALKEQAFTAVNFEDHAYILYGDGETLEARQDAKSDEIHFSKKALRPGEQRRRFASCADGRAVYVAGGENEEGEKSKEVFRYLPKEDIWEQLPDLPYPTSHGALVHLDGHLYFMGGMQNRLMGLFQHSPSKRVERLNLSEGNWERVADLPYQRYSGSAVAVNGRIHYLGGSDRELAGILWESFQEGHYVYEPEGDVWIEAAPLPLARSRFGILYHDHCIYCMGGRTGEGYTSSVKVYNVDNEHWRAEASLNHPRSHVAALVLGDRLLALGGKTQLAYEKILEEQVSSLDFYVHRLDHYL